MKLINHVERLWCITECTPDVMVTLVWFSRRKLEGAWVEGVSAVSVKIARLNSSRRLMNTIHQRWKSNRAEALHFMILSGNITRAYRDMSTTIAAADVTVYLQLHHQQIFAVSSKAE